MHRPYSQPAKHGVSGLHLAHTSKPVIPRDRLIRLPEVESVVGCKKSTIYTMLAKGEFPKPVRLSARTVAWPETAVLQWVQDRINAAGAVNEKAVQA